MFHSRVWSTLTLTSALVGSLCNGAAAHILDHDRVSEPLTAVDERSIPDFSSESSVMRRANSPVNVCLRWAQQSAVINGTLYLYGGQATTQPSQTTDTWNNNFLSLDLTKTWQISSPALTGLPQPSGPPAVALGYLWHSRDSLYLYGGEFEWKSSGAPVTPPPFSLWEYDVSSGSWNQHGNPVTSAGVNAPSNNVAVQRAAEGAGVSVPSLGRGFYFGGHLDAYTTPGWSVQVARVYLQSLLEYTFPGFANNQVTSLSNGQTAGQDGSYRNITVGGLQSQAGFTARADGLLIYVPGFGDQGILLALAGGTNQTFTQMNNINVYDIAKSTWYTQSTSGPTPKIRVNPCAVVAAAADGSSYNVYMFGGQNLIPFGEQIQYNDMWILSLPSFTWIQVDQTGQSVPYGRAGATCNIWDAQMVMVGGYVGDQLSCDSPGIYVFDLSTLKWVNQYTALNAGSNNPFNQQSAQLANATSPGGLEGSYNYQVPDAVISVIGGSKTGGATITAPVAAATEGPLATGKPITYTVTNPDGSVATGVTGGGNNNGMNNPSMSSTSSGTRIAAIVVGVVAGLLLILAGYLAFCAYIYRKQVQLYKRHAELLQAQQQENQQTSYLGAAGAGLLAAKSSSEKSPSHHRFSSSNHGGAGLGAGRNSEIGSLHSTSVGGADGGDLVPVTTAGGYTSLLPAGAGAAGGAAGMNMKRRDSADSGVEDILAYHEPTFVGVMLHPRRSLRIVNRD